MIVSLGSLVIGTMSSEDSFLMGIGVIGFWVFSIWSIVILFKNAPDK